jgi:hypothetical protein
MQLKHQSPREEGFGVDKESDACPEPVEGMTYFGYHTEFIEGG